MLRNEANQDIRKRAEALELPLWRLAEAAGISDTTITRWLRVPLPLCDPRRVQLMSALAMIERERKQHGKEEGKSVSGR